MGRETPRGGTLLEAHRIATAEGREELTAGELRTINRLYAGALAHARTDNPHQRPQPDHRLHE